MTRTDGGTEVPCMDRMEYEEHLARVGEDEREWLDRRLGLRHLGRVAVNLSVPDLVHTVLCRGEGRLASNGAVVVRGGERTGRSPLDRFFVEEAEAAADIDWGEVNRPVPREVFDRIWARARAYLQGRDVFVFRGFVGADEHYRMKVRVVAEKAWHALFAHTLFVRPSLDEILHFEEAPGDEVFTVVNCARMRVGGKEDGVRSDVFVGIDFDRRLVLICGTYYGGEIKKAIFTVMNHLLPLRGVFPMHCSANVGERGDVALFFGLSGTGKTTLSADPARRLVGDDEHGWSDDGVFNFEGGCYAKVINLSREAEPQIWEAIRFGSILENVILDPMTGVPDYCDGSITQNTRATYPLEHIPSAVIPPRAGHPSNVFLLTCDAFGVLPPIARLTPEQAMYYFISGYTAKVAGTESGIDEPQATFSAGFGAPFLPRRPAVYAGMLADRMKKHSCRCWLVNTGWSGGPYGVGRRMPIGVTRALLRAALDGVLDEVEYKREPWFGLDIPVSCPGVDSKLLDPSSTWSDPEEYAAKAAELASAFRENMRRYEEGTPSEVIEAGPPRR